MPPNHHFYPTFIYLAHTAIASLSGDTSYYGKEDWHNSHNACTSLIVPLAKIAQMINQRPTCAASRRLPDKYGSSHFKYMLL
jgi:hypothetical protein